MSPTIISFIGLTVTLIAFLIYHIKESNEWWIITLVVILIFFGIFGWGAFLSTVVDDERTTVKTIKANIVEIVKGKHITVVSTSENHNVIYSGYQSDMIDTTTNFTWKYTNYYNYYGSELSIKKEFIATKDTLSETKLERQYN